MENMIYVNRPDELTFISTPDTSRKEEQSEPIEFTCSLCRHTYPSYTEGQARFVPGVSGHVCYLCKTE